MGRQETNIQNSIRLAFGDPAGGVRLYRNETGFDPKHKITYGLCKGSSDLIGWKSIIVTPEMVGELFARFVAIEVKTPVGTASKEQKHFVADVRECGGIAGFARSIEEANRILKGAE